MEKRTKQSSPLGLVFYQGLLAEHNLLFPALLGDSSLTSDLFIPSTQQVLMQQAVSVG